MDNLEEVQVDPWWNHGDERESKLHKIHTYPAKFPAFIPTKTFELAKRKNVDLKTVADVFCGCGTVALEANRNGLDFWGCDLNPVATLIARVKSRRLQQQRLIRYFERIQEHLSGADQVDHFREANARLKYWYSKGQYNKLFQIKAAIEATTPANSPYREFFLCAFSNILKPASRWLTKSIKPQIDKSKKRREVRKLFEDQVGFMLKANLERPNKTNQKCEISTGSFLHKELEKPKVDLIVTSPPYVTSYEYADLHQLSSLWLGFASDYRALRDGSIGSLHHVYNFERELKRLNDAGTKVVLQLFDKDRAKAKSVTKYYLDMQDTAKECYEMLNPNGMALFLLGNTEYRDIRIDNAAHFAESLRSVGFKVEISKRKISGKILTPYRTKEGRFTNTNQGRKVYAEEFILIASK